MAVLGAPPRRRTNGQGDIHKRINNLGRFRDIVIQPTLASGCRNGSGCLAFQMKAMVAEKAAALAEAESNYDKRKVNMAFQGLITAVHACNHLDHSPSLLPSLPTPYASSQGKADAGEMLGCATEAVAGLEEKMGLSAEMGRLVGAIGAGGVKSPPGEGAQGLIKPEPPVRPEGASPVEFDETAEAAGKAAEEVAEAEEVSVSGIFPSLVGESVETSLAIATSVWSLRRRRKRRRRPRRKRRRKRRRRRKRPRRRKRLPRRRRKQPRRVRRRLPRRRRPRPRKVPIFVTSRPSSSSFFPSVSAAAEE